MTDQLVAETLSRFRAKAAEAGVSSRNVELLISSFLPAVYPQIGGDGPVVVHLGGDNPMLPVGAGKPSEPFLCSIDCAQIPPNSTGLPLPADGHLLLFGDAEKLGQGPGPGYVVYVPAGTPTTEVPAPEPVRGSYEERDYRSVRVGPSWPSSGPDGFADPSDDESEMTVEDYELMDQLSDIWGEAGGNYFGSDLYLGGHADFWNDDPVELANEYEYGGGNDWCLLANWYCDDVVALPLPRMHWLIRRQDLADLRFDRVMISVDMHG
ncbi:DUF1963 domain-containing protein [Streptomyces sp. NPDC016845]|uniref:DUF1963 domain-containing protein n=1 Tax=Streptomyces sp. NPDC016845 TaxID=3364972 RepID=UPI0037A7B730